MKIILRVVAGLASLLTILVSDQAWFESLPKTVEEAGGAESDQTLLRVLTIVLSVVGAALGGLIARLLSGKRPPSKMICLSATAVVMVVLYLATSITKDAWSTVYSGQLVWTGIWIEEDVRKANPTLNHAQLLAEFGGHADEVWPPYSRLLGRLIPSTAFCFLLTFGVFTIVLSAELLASEAESA